METKLFWKSVIRRTGSLLLLLALIAVSTFGFMLRAVEYLSVNQEIERISREYRPVGTLSVPEWDVTEGALAVMESPYVELADVNRFCPAVLSDLYNADIEGYISESGDAERYRQIGATELMAWGKVMTVSDTLDPNVKIYDFQIQEGVYGYPEYIQPEQQIRLKLAFPEDEAGPMPVLERGKSYLIKGRPSPEDNVQTKLLTVRLLPLEEDVWFLEGEPNDGIAEKYLGENFELQERNRHALSAVTTRDMTVMPLVQEASRDFYLEEGRWITKQDQDEGKRVCVIHKELASVRGLSVGDSLTVTFQNRIDTGYGYATPQEDVWESGEKTEETLEIVGIYGRMYGGSSDDYQVGDCNYIYVPDSCIPEHYAKRDIIEKKMFSFVLTDPREKDLFLQETEALLAPMGITISFVENNWENFYQSARSVEQGGFFSVIIFGTLLVLAFAAVVFLYTWQRRKECAIARAMGIPAKKAAVCSCLPLMVLGIPAILAGGLLAWKFGLDKAGETLAALEAGAQTDLSWFWLWWSLLLVWLLLSAALLIGSLFSSGKSVLEVLQGRRHGR